MAKSYVSYSEILSEEKPLDCVYLVEGFCTAQAVHEPGLKIKYAKYYQPTDEERKNFCNNSDKFKECPRFTAYQSHLNAMGLTKK